MLISSDHPAWVCNRCESNLRAAVKIRRDITQIEECWSKYIDEMHAINEIKIEDDENENFETVEMTIEPVDHMYNSTAYGADYLDDSKSEHERNYESRSADDDASIDNFGGSVSDLNDSQDKFVEKKNCTVVLSRIDLQKSYPEVATVSQFKCDICEARYSSRYGIRTHMKRHMQGSADSTSLKKIKRYQCSKCDERFSKKILLEEHELRHLGVCYWIYLAILTVNHHNNLFFFLP